MEKYLLQPSQDTPNGWVLTDTEHGLVCQFTEGYFKSTCTFTMLDDAPEHDALLLAKLNRELTDWLLANHPDKLLVRSVIGRRIEELRKLRGIRQKDLADLTGYRVMNISRIEQARYSTGIDIVGKMCDALESEIFLVPKEKAEEVRKLVKKKISKESFDDDLEIRVADMLKANHIRYIHESQGGNQRLDFYLPDYDIYIEVKRAHTPRVISQLESQDNVILVQGMKSVQFLEALLKLD